MASPVVGIIMGVIFGASLVLAGLTNPDRIIGALRLKDFHAIRTVVFFVLVAMLGTWILGLFGAANLSIKPAVVLSVMIGGALIGIGLGLTGFSPATSLASAASGRIDALITVVGMIFGAHVYILIYPSVVVRLEKIFNFGNVTLPELTGVSAGIWVLSIFVAGSLVLLITWSMQPRFGEADLGVKGAFPASTDSQTVAGGMGLLLRSDYIKAAYVFRRWKNLLFLVMLLCLLLNQASFWLVITGQVEISGNTNFDAPVVAGADNTRAGQTTPEEGSGSFMLFGYNVTFGLLSSIMRVTSIILILASAFYALIMSFGMSVSFKGGLGGLNHICGALYMALIIFVLLMPWQAFFGPLVLGATYTTQELIRWSTTDISDNFTMVLFYLRFSGYLALILLLLILTQLRSLRWVRAIKAVSREDDRNPNP